MDAVFNSRHGQIHAHLDKWPDWCPVCNHAIHPRGLDYAVGTDEWIEKPFQCPREACEHMFIAVYRNQRLPNFGEADSYALAGLLPFTFVPDQFSEIIANVSKTFVSIYQQSQHAEARKLDLVCGPGYRKALEFLIKDYVRDLHPSDAEKIERMPLASCINEYVKNERIQAVAARAAWLGNDETHYVRVWQKKDVQDLKGLISLTVRWIEIEEQTKAIIKDMPDPKAAQAKKGALKS